MERIRRSRLDSFLDFCPVCGFPLVDRLYSCPNCVRHPGMKTRLMLSYKDPFARSFLELYKFDGRKEFSRFFADLLSECIEAGEVALPVPSSNASLKKRGWDQMDRISKDLKCPVARLLVNNYTGSLQSKEMNEKERIEFSRDKFAVDLSPLRPCGKDGSRGKDGCLGARSRRAEAQVSGLSGKQSVNFDTPLVVMDDVFTTGSTMFAAYSVLVASGFSNVRTMALYGEF